MKVYYDKDADLRVLKEKTIAVIGYGHQGHAQAQNLKDNGLKVIVGNPKDEFWSLAEKDGFKVYPIDKASELGDILMILIPDEVQTQVYDEMIKDKLKPGKVLSFASGYNVNFGFIDYPKDVDVIMVAPKMVGESVRTLFLEGKGSPTQLAVEQDSSGKAWEICKAVAKGIGGTRAGAFKSTFEEEACSDLFLEQALFGPGMYAMLAAHEVMVEAGFSPEAVQIEFYGSGEGIEVERLRVEHGWAAAPAKFFSNTCMFGAYSRGPPAGSEEVKKEMRKVLEVIRNGTFARQWKLEQHAGMPFFKKMRKQLLEHSINEVEKRTRKFFHFVKKE